MIVRLRGEVIENNGGTVVIDCQGVGYEVQVPMTTSYSLPVGAISELYVRHVVREDDESLYGFVSKSDRDVFDLLRSVKGCGPKISLAVISDLGNSGTIETVTAQDTKGLTRVSGVGPRLAERIIVELKEKVVHIGLEARAGARQRDEQNSDDDLVQALVALGYRRSDIASVADAAKDESDELGEQLKVALRKLR